MARKKRAELKEEDLQGFKYFKILEPFLDSLHEVGTQRDKAQNRQLHFDQYGALLLLYFFNPVLTSLRGIQQASHLEKVQKKLGCRGTSLGSLSEAASVFDAQKLEKIIAELAALVPQQILTRDQRALGDLTAVDGSLLPALSKMAWALWLDEEHRAARMHVAFEVMRGIPVKVTVTKGSGNEKHELRGMLEPGRLYVVDRGYAEYRLFQDIQDRGSSFIGRIRNNALWRVVEERPVSTKARAAGLRRDLVVRLGNNQTGAALKQPLRVVEVETGKTDSQGKPVILLLATDRMDLDAELVAVGYRFRWSVELFFRWLKCILGCRHLLSHSQNGVTIQVYLAIIASLLVSLWTGRKPTKRTFEMLCFYFSGMASEGELLAHIAKLKLHDA
jgi:hypothetical protein